MSDWNNRNGARIAAIGNAAATHWLRWLVNEAEPPKETHDVQFALAHSDEGVTWGFLQEQTWQLSHNVNPNLSPLPTVEALHELRIFGGDAEVLIWRTDAGLRGRILTHDASCIQPSDPIAPIFEHRFLRGHAQSEQLNGFVLYVDSGGAQHLAPAAFGQGGEEELKLGVCHYLHEDPDSGAVRIAATRLAVENVS